MEFRKETGELDWGKVTEDWDREEFARYSIYQSMVRSLCKHKEWSDEELLKKYVELEGRIRKVGDTNFREVLEEGKKEKEEVVHSVDACLSDKNL